MVSSLLHLLALTTAFLFVPLAKLGMLATLVTQEISSSLDLSRSLPTNSRLTWLRSFLGRLQHLIRLVLLVVEVLVVCEQLREIDSVLVKQHARDSSGQVSVVVRDHQQVVNVVSNEIISVASSQPVQLRDIDGRQCDEVLVVHWSLHLLHLLAHGLLTEVRLADWLLLLQMMLLWMLLLILLVPHLASVTSPSAVVASSASVMTSVTPGMVLVVVLGVGVDVESLLLRPHILPKDV